MSRIPRLRRFHKVVSMLLRLAALAGRFGFAIVAVFFMEPIDYGIYGLIVAGTYTLSQIAGIEAFQSVVRRIVHGYGPGEVDDRPPYLRFVAFSALLAFAMGAAMGLYFGWSATVTLMGGAIVALEYVGIEVMRLLVAEKRAELSIYSVSTRFVVWSIGFPLAGLTGIMPGPWPIDAVLAAWLVSSIASVLFLWPVRKAYLAPLPVPFWRWYWAILRTSPQWIAIALTGRFLETGIRMVPGFAIDESAAGRFSFLATIAGISGIALKAVVEPYYFAAMVHPDTGTAARRAFANITLSVNAIGFGMALAVWYGTTVLGGRDMGQHSGLIVAVLACASAATSISQIPHFRLYAARRDRQLVIASLWTLALGLPTVACGAIWFGLLGTALGALATSGLFLMLKLTLARGVEPAPLPP